ncbi:hypothetical protein TNCV_3824431 [Trichonephila clavipes]|nr:hypothetical protein TNCV_3824431 [Trichonephila clavipes]
MDPKFPERDIFIYFNLFLYISVNINECRPTGIVVSDAECGAVGTGRKSSRVVGGRGREVGGPWPLPSILSQNWGGNEPNSTVTGMVLKATVNDMRHLALSPDEFHGPLSSLCRSDAISNNNNNNNINDLYRALSRQPPGVNEGEGIQRADARRGGR